MESENELLQTISRRLGVLIALQMKTQSEDFSTTEGVALLSRFGMANNEIAEILNTSSNTVNVIKNRIKKRK
jgi:DNA-binding CsgD family transcriptional regulator